MLLVIHNLPSNVKYSEIKALIQSKCGLTDFVLDNLLSEGTTKRVTVGLADEGDAAFLVRKINGLYLNSQQLYVEDVRQSRPSEQPYRPKPQDFNNYQPNNYQPNNYQRDLPRNQSIQEPQAPYHNDSKLGYQDNALGYQNNSKMMYEDSSVMNQNMAMMMNYNMAMGGMYYQPQMMALPQQTGYLGFADQSQQMHGMAQLTKPQQDQSLGYGGPAGDNRAGGWDDKNIRRMRVKNERSPSPDRGQRLNASHWEAPKPVPLPEALRRSPSAPRRNWDNGPSVTSFAKYYDEAHPRVKIEPKSYGQQRTFRSNFADPTSMNKPAANIYGNHVINQQKREFSRRQQWNESDSFQRKGRDNAREPRGGNFAFAKKGLKPFGRQSRDEGPKPTKKWRDEPKVAPKRFAERWHNDEPPQKKFAQPKAPKHDGDITKTWREHAPRSEGASKFAKPPELSVTKVLNKDDTWRGQVASYLAKDMASKLKQGLTAVVMTRLKRSIRSRINLLLGSTIASERPEIESRYRAEFPSSGDSEFLQAVIETVKEEQAAAAAEQLAAGDTQSDTHNATAPRPVKPTAPNPVPAKEPQAKTPKPTVQFNSANPKLPKFPNADKKSVHRIKVEERKKKEEIVKELTPALQKTLEEEVDVLSDLFMSECMDPSNEQEKVVCEEIADVVSDEFRKLIRLHMTKRLLNMNTSLTVRAISQGKVIHRDLLEAFVKDYGAVALKKSEKGGKLYLVYINTYDNYDKLCALGEVIIGGFNVKFKPLHVLGAPPSAKEIREQMIKRNSKFLQSQMDKSEENLLAPGYSITPTVDSVAAQGDSAENAETGNQISETGDQSQEFNVQTQETDDEQTQETDVEQTEKTNNQNIELEIENPETGEVNVGVSEDSQEGDVYDIEADEEETGDWNQENGVQVQECDVEDVYECEPNEIGGENVDEDDLEDY